jgi:RHS repeat-associated protein
VDVTRTAPAFTAKRGRRLLWWDQLRGKRKTRSLRRPRNVILSGQYFDGETGLHYNYFRDYDPATGRYVESDPVGLSGGINSYAYVSENPVGFVDPYGLSQTCPTCKQTFLDCLANCISKYDPLSDRNKAKLTLVGGTFPKKWIGVGRGLGGASPVTTVPSAAAYGAGGGAAGTVGAVARGIGRIASPVWITYGLYLFGMESWCAASCTGDHCAH